MIKVQETGKDVLFDKFEALECFKKDDHSSVYLAKDINSSKKVILKILNTSNLPRRINFRQI